MNSWFRRCNKTTDGIFWKSRWDVWWTMLPKDKYLGVSYLVCFIHLFFFKAGETEIREHDDQEDDILSAAIICLRRDSHRTDIPLVRELNLLLQLLNVLLLWIDASNFNLIFI